VHPASADEIVLPKTSSSVFNNTSIAKTLGNLGTRNLVLVGCLTDQCVESAVRDACDLNFLVTGEGRGVINLGKTMEAPS
jgi:ureidoacrylate peracid hydrolase